MLVKSKLFRRDFSLVVIGQIISILGSALLRFALNLYILDLTGRADIFAIVIAVSSIPGILMMPIGGVIADRVNRRNLMVIFDFCSSITVMALFGLLISGNASILPVGCVLAILATISGMYQPAVQASIPVLVDEPHLAQANGIVNGVGALSGLLGPILGGALYGFVGLPTLVIVSCVAFFLSAIMEIFIHIPFTKKSDDRHTLQMVWADMKDGIRFVSREKPAIFRAIIMAAALNLFLTPFFIIGVPYVLRVTMQSNDMMYGIGLGLAELSTILGALSIGIFSKRMRMDQLYRWILVIAVLLIPMSVVVSPMFLSLGFWPSFVLFSACAIVIVSMMTLLSVFVITHIQHETPNEMLGKVMAIIMTIAHCAAPLGQLLFGGLFEINSAQVYIPILLTCGFTTVLSIVGKRLLSVKQSLKPEHNMA